MALILIIDDDAQIRDVLRRMLEPAGHDVIEAADGVDGIRAYREKPADLIITDLIMPKKEGVELIMELKMEFPDVKIIAISGGGRIGPETYLEVAEGFGAMRTFTKPFRIKNLLKTISELLG
ncbi:response regulator [Thermodesulfobacteriota bacterium]